MKNSAADNLGRRKRRRFSPEQKQALIAAFRRHTGTVRQFVQLHELTYSAFRKWLKKAEQPIGKLIPIRVVRSAPARTGAPMHVHLTNGRKVELLPGFDPESVGQLICLLEELC